MLKPQALANALAGSIIIFYIILFVLKIIAPPFFRLILNSQFFGADIAAQIPSFNLANFLGFLITLGVVSWTFGYLAATIYNKFKS